LTEEKRVDGEERRELTEKRVDGEEN